MRECKEGSPFEMKDMKPKPPPTAFGSAPRFLSSYGLPIRVIRGPIFFWFIGSASRQVPLSAKWL
jgi:hypothetical protein